MPMRPTLKTGPRENEYVCYRGLLASTKRVYMQTATAVEAHWVPAEAESEEEDDEPGPPA